MNIYLNHQLRVVPQDHTLAMLLAEIVPQSPFAVAINQEFVPKGHYGKVVLQAEDHIDIVQPVVGG